MKKLYSIAICALLSLSLLSCGPSKKIDQEDELGKTGNKQGDGRGGSGGGSQPETIEEVCANLTKGIVLHGICQYQKFNIKVESPKENDGRVFQYFVGQATKGMVIETIGDPTEIAHLWYEIDVRKYRFLSIGARLARELMPSNGSLYVIANEPFKEPAQIRGYECINLKRTVVPCPQ